MDTNSVMGEISGQLRAGAAREKSLEIVMQIVISALEVAKPGLQQKISNAIDDTLLRIDQSEGMEGVASELRAFRGRM